LGRKIVLLSDGTGNSAAKVWRTNVWRVFESIDLSTSDQIAAYDDGVGTSSFKPLAIFGGAFGYGLKRNVIDLYKFACRNYRSPEDEIFAFGFSRGAFTIRVVIGLILEQGIIRANSEAELNTLARQPIAISAGGIFIRSGAFPKQPPGRYAISSSAPTIQKTGTSIVRGSVSSASGTRSPPMACRSRK
jgi:uncharacterized protein (DUF2235 family)